jgi:hypothetical protein
VTDLVGLIAEDSVTIIIDAEDPVVDITEIEDTVMIGDTVTFKGTATDDIQIIKLELELENGDTFDISTYIQEDGTWSYVWNSSTAKEGELKVSVKGTDVVHKISTDEISIKLISITTDTDDDGIPDWWELKFGLNPNLDDSYKDIDKDDFTNLDEYLGKDNEPGNDDYSDPTDKLSVPFEKSTEPDPEEGSGKPNKDSDSDNMIYIILGIIVIIIVLVMVFVLMRKKKQKDEEAELKDMPMTHEGQVGYNDQSMVLQPPLPPPIAAPEGSEQLLPIPPPQMMTPQQPQVVLQEPEGVDQISTPPLPPDTQPQQVATQIVDEEPQQVAPQVEQSLNIDVQEPQDTEQPPGQEQHQQPVLTIKVPTIDNNK